MIGDKSRWRLLLLLFWIAPCLVLVCSPATVGWHWGCQTFASSISKKSLCMGTLPCSLML